MYIDVVVLSREQALCAGQQSRNNSTNTCNDYSSLLVDPFKLVRFLELFNLELLITISAPSYIKLAEPVV